MARTLDEPVRAARIAAVLGRELRGVDVLVDRVAPISSPEPGALLFANESAVDLVARAASIENVVVIVPATFEPPAGISVIASPRPRLDFARALAAFFAPPPPTGVHPSATIDPTATLGAGVAIGPGCVVGPQVSIGAGTELRAHVVVREDVRIGARCLVKSHTVIGEEGFAFEFDEAMAPIRIPHLGSVRIGDDVEIGATCVIARGTLADTVLGDRVKIDDHVFIAHNVRVDENTVIIAGAEVSGSVHIGAGAWLSPQVCIKDGVEIGARALLGMGAVVLQDVEANSVVVGNPARRLRARFKD